MEVNNALSILGIARIKDKEELKKLYRKKIKEVHPDNGGSEELSYQVTNAYKILEIAYDNGYFVSINNVVNRPSVDMSGYKKKEILVAYVTIEQLVNIVNGGVEAVVINGDTIDLSKDNFRNVKVIIKDKIKVECDNTVYWYSVSASYNYINHVPINLVINRELDSNITVYILDKSFIIAQMKSRVSRQISLDSLSLIIDVVR